MQTANSSATWQGMALAALAALIWSGNFVVARGTIHDIPPVQLAFARWACASLLMIPIGLRLFQQQRQDVARHLHHLFWAALFGVSIFNTLVYIAGHHTDAISLALVGTTSSPVFAFILARIFLREQIPPRRVAGLLLCIAGIIVILSKGSWSTLRHLRFTAGDGWILLAALSFAVYNILARRKPVNLHPVTYLAATFWIGTLLLLPAAVAEYLINPQRITWSPGLAGVILYLGAGTSVAAFFCWNAAIARLGAARTAIFGNLIPVFSSIEAVWILQERMTAAHLAGMALVFAGLLLANLRGRTPAAPATQIPKPVTPHAPAARP